MRLQSILESAEAAEISPSQPLLVEARGVWKWLSPNHDRPPALREVDLDAPAAAWTVLTGPSGSGKTTLLSLAGALDRPSCGTIRFDGRDLGRLSDIALARVRRDIGFVFQGFALIPRLPIWENVTYPLIPRGTPRRARYARAVELLARVGLDGVEEKRPEELSGGEQQRAAIARSLAAEPRMLIADEPTASLDAAAATAVRQILIGLHSRGVTLLVATHDDEMRDLADRQYALCQGVCARTA